MSIARLTAASILAFADPLHAQDLMLFPPETFGQVVAPRNESMLDVQLEAQVGAYNNEFVSNYGDRSIFARTGRAVGMLQILTNVGHAPCTGFLVDGNMLVTNHHCVPGILDHPRMKEKGATSIAAVQFHAGFLRDGLTEGVKSFHVNPVPLETSEALDYTVLQVLGDANAEFGALELTAALPNDRDPFWVIGHPMGEAQRISREKCQADSPAVASHRLRHTCDTLPGNSGSPVIDAGSQKVIGLHHAGSRAGEVNCAVPMAEILAQSKVLKASVGGGDADLSALQAELARLRAERKAERAKAEAERKRLAEEAERLALGKAEAERLARVAAEEEKRKLAEAEAERERLVKEAAARQTLKDQERTSAERERKANSALLAALKVMEVAARREALLAVTKDHAATMAAQAADLALARLSSLDPPAPTPGAPKTVTADPAGATRLAALAVPAPEVKPLSDAEAEAGLDLGADDYLEIQRQLDALGFGLGTPDGVFGPASRRATRAFQKDRGLEETGYLNAGLVALIAERHEAAPADLDGEYMIYFKRRWDDDWFTKNPARDYSPGRTETLAKLLVKRENGRLTVLRVTDQTLLTRNDAYEDIRLSLSDDGDFSVQTTVNYLFRKSRTRQVSVSADLPERWTVNRAVTFEGGMYDPAFRVHIWMQRLK